MCHMKPSEILAAAREIQCLGHYKGAAARDANGKDVPLMSAKAVSFCMVGSVRRVGRGSVLDAENILRRSLGTVGIVEVNDAPDFTHLDAVEAFERAILLARSEEQ